MTWEKKKVLVTGGAGLIGSNLVYELSARGAEVRVADNLWRGKKKYLVRDGNSVIDMGKQFFSGDLVNYENCRKAVANQDVVYHLADIVAGINYVFGNQFSLFNTNMLIDSHMLQACIAEGVKEYVYVGTACSYPAEKQNRLNPPLFREEDVYPASPESSYGWAKLMGEYQAGLALEDGLLDVGLLRFHNVYGPPCEMSVEKSQVIPALIRKALNYPKEDFVVWGSGEQCRAFLYVADAVDALVKVLEKGMNQGVIQIGPDTSTSVGDIARKIVMISRKSIPIMFDTSKPEGDKDRAADWSKAKRVLGWAPKHTIDTGLAKTYNWCEKELSNSHIVE